MVLVHGWSWFSKREYMSKKSEETGKKIQAERKDLSDFINGLSFNKVKGGKSLIMISGDIHFLSFSQGGSAHNPFGSFPLFQCAPLDKRSSCKLGMEYTSVPQFNNGQYCTFEVSEPSADSMCVSFTGYTFDRPLMTFNNCESLDQIQNTDKLK